MLGIKKEIGIKMSVSKDDQFLLANTDKDTNTYNNLLVKIFI